MGIADIQIPQQKSFWSSALEGYEREEDRKLERKESDRKDRESDRQDKLVEIEAVKSDNADKIAEQTLFQTKRTNFMNDLKLLPPDVGAVFARNFLAGDNEGVIDANFVDQYAEVGNTYNAFQDSLDSYFTGDDTYIIDNYSKLASLAIESGQQNILPHIKSSYDSAFDKQSRKNTMDLALSLLPEKTRSQISGVIGKNYTDASLGYMEAIIKSNYKSPDEQNKIWSDLLEGYVKAQAGYDDMTSDDIKTSTARAITDIQSKIGLTPRKPPAPPPPALPSTVKQEMEKLTDNQKAMVNKKFSKIKPEDVNKNQEKILEYIHSIKDMSVGEEIASLHNAGDAFKKEKNRNFIFQNILSPKIQKEYVEKFGKVINPDNPEAMKFLEDNKFFNILAVMQSKAGRLTGEEFKLALQNNPELIK